MKKNETKKAIAYKLLVAYLAYAESVNVHQKPVEGVNSGAEGRAFERAINFLLGLLARSESVQGAGLFDAIKYMEVNGKKKRITIEIKTGAGTLATLDEDGNILTSPLMKSDFVAYTPQFYPELEVENQVLFFETSVFLDILKKHGLIRKKVSGKMNTKKKSGGTWYYDILSIQSFKNSKKKYHAFTTDLFFEGMTFNDFVEEYNITIK